jgi:hypothetical protein
MQTFLPYADYAQSAAVLDQKRLGKQRVETLQIMQVLLGERLITSDKFYRKDGRIQRIPRDKAKWTREPLTSKGWRNHPAVTMWRGHELELLRYQEAICNEWTSRGYKDTCLEKTRELVAPHLEKLSEGEPSWLGDDKFHLGHKSNLKRKNEEFYSTVWPKIASDLPYEWPANNPAE